MELIQGNFIITIGYDVREQGVLEYLLLDPRAFVPPNVDLALAYATGMHPEVIQRDDERGLLVMQCQVSLLHKKIELEDVTVYLITDQLAFVAPTV